MGSNAAPVQLRRKFAKHLDGVVIPVVKITIPGHIIAWGKHIAPYGAITPYGVITGPWIRKTEWCGNRAWTISAAYPKKSGLSLNGGRTRQPVGTAPWRCFV